MTATCAVCGREMTTREAIRSDCCAACDLPPSQLTVDDAIRWVAEVVAPTDEGIRNQRGVITLLRQLKPIRVVWEGTCDVHYGLPGYVTEIFCGGEDLLNYLRNVDKRRVRVSVQIMSEDEVVQ